MPKIDGILQELRDSGRFRSTQDPSAAPLIDLSPEQATALLVVGTGLLILVLGLLALQLAPLFRKNAALKDLPEPAVPVLDWQKLRDQAQALAQQGDFRGSSRAWYLALILWLDSEKRVRYQPTRTNFEYLEDLVDQPQLHVPFARLIKIYERLWYGEQPGTAQDAAQCQEVVTQVQRTNRL